MKQISFSVKNTLDIRVKGFCDFIGFGIDINGRWFCNHYHEI